MIFWRDLEEEDKDKVTKDSIVEIPFRAFDLMKFKEKIEDDGVIILGVEFEGNNISFIGAKEQS